MSKQIRLTILIFAFLAVVISGWRMWDLFQNDILWGHLPLIFFISLWICMLGWFTRKNWQDSGRFNLIFGWEPE